LGFLGGGHTGKWSGLGQGHRQGQDRGRGRDKLARNAAESVTNVGVCTLPFINHD